MSTINRRLIMAMLGAAIALSACSNGAGDLVAGPGELRHIHDLVIENDGSLLVASHTGLFRVESIDRAVLVGTERHDLMSMTADNADIVASGHPDLRPEKYRVDDLPPHMGLARSDDSGQTWTVEADLLGKHDFHALVSTDVGVYAADAAGLIMLRTSSGEWQNLGSVAARDLAANPLALDQLVATDEDGAAWYSSDGAVTWDSLPNAPAAIEIEWTANNQIIAASKDGNLWQTTTPNDTWTKITTGPSEVETLHIEDDQWWVTIQGGAIHSSTDHGESWTQVYMPPER
ncbi:MAG: hypothetical protein ACI8Y4_003499 [Candidatus Poriferisodalaceae bacterium]|jgi:hypothetical protein